MGQASVFSASHYPLIIVGAGIHGASLAWEAARRGVDLLLLDRSDFGSGVSANSLRTIHGGLRYLQNADFHRARISACEQEQMLNGIPHLVRPMPCVVPTYRNLKRSRMALASGLLFYHTVIRAGLKSFPQIETPLGILNVAELKRLISNARLDDVTGGAAWIEAQAYAPERLVLSYVLSAKRLGAECHNYYEVTSVLNQNNCVTGVQVRDTLTGGEQRLGCKVLVDATGSGIVPEVDFGKQEPGWLKAVNLVLAEKPNAYAFGLNITEQQGNNRFLFFAPWRNHTIAGTWYFRAGQKTDNSNRLTFDELKQCLQDVGGLLKNNVRHDKIRHVDIGFVPAEFGGISDESGLLKKSRLLDGREYGMSGLIRMIGVKLTTARHLADRLIDQVLKKYLPFKRPETSRLYSADYSSWPDFVKTILDRFGHCLDAPELDELLALYGSCAVTVLENLDLDSADNLYVPGSRTTIAEIDYVLANELVRTTADVVLRRTGIGGTGHPAAETINYLVNRMAQHNQWDAARIKQEEAGIGDWYDRFPLAESTV